MAVVIGLKVNVVVMNGEAVAVAVAVGEPVLEDELVPTRIPETPFHLFSHMIRKMQQQFCLLLLF